MIARRTAQVINVSRNVGAPDQAVRQQTSLRQTWNIDPATGKLVACWVVERVETAPSVAFNSAA